jgi:hypothetical protein
MTAPFASRVRAAGRTWIEAQTTRNHHGDGRISDEVAAGPITDAATRAPDMLEDLDEALNAKGISLVFAAIEDPVRGIKR